MNDKIGYLGLPYEFNDLDALVASDAKLAANDELKKRIHAGTDVGAGEWTVGQKLDHLNGTEFLSLFYEGVVYILSGVGHSAVVKGGEIIEPILDWSKTPDIVRVLFDEMLQDSVGGASNISSEVLNNAKRQSEYWRKNASKTADYDPQFQVGDRVLDLSGTIGGPGKEGVITKIVATDYSHPYWASSPAYLVKLDDGPSGVVTEVSLQKVSSKTGKTYRVLTVTDNPYVEREYMVEADSVADANKKVFEQHDTVDGEEVAKGETFDLDSQASKTSGAYDEVGDFFPGMKVDQINLSMSGGMRGGTVKSVDHDKTYDAITVEWPHNIDSSGVSFGEPWSSTYGPSDLKILGSKTAYKSGELYTLKFPLTVWDNSQENFVIPRGYEVEITDVVSDNFGTSVILLCEQFSGDNTTDYSADALDFHEALGGTVAKIASEEFEPQDKVKIIPTDDSPSDIWDLEGMTGKLLKPTETEDGTGWLVELDPKGDYLNYNLKPLTVYVLESELQLIKMGFKISSEPKNPSKCPNCDAEMQVGAICPSCGYIDPSNPNPPKSS